MTQPQLKNWLKSRQAAYSLAYLAKQCGVSRPNLSKWLSGHYQYLGKTTETRKEFADKLYSELKKLSIHEI